MFLKILKSHVKNVFALLLALCMLVPSLVMAANNAVIGAQTVPINMVAGEPYSITMSFKNTGTTSWTSAAKYCAKLLNPTGWEVTSRCVATTVAVNGFLYVNHNGVAPSTPGVYNYQWQMEQQGVGLFGTPSTNFVITVAPRVQNAQFVSHTVPAVLNAGTRAISFTMKNAGNVTWKAGQYALVAQNPAENATWGVSRLMLATATVAPGATGAFTGTITAPTTLGYYGMQWRPMEVGKDYIGEATPPLNIPISGAGPAVNVQSPTAGQAFIGDAGFIEVPIKVTATPTGVATVSKIEILAYNTANSTLTEVDQVDGPIYEKTLRRAAVDQTLYAKATDSFGKFTQSIIKIDALLDGATVVSHTIPAKMVPNGEYDVTVTMKNTGGTTWTPQGVELITTNPVGNTTYGITSMPLTTTVPPGGTAVFSGRLKAPANEGTVQTQWRLREKSRAVFGSAVLVSVAIAREIPVVTLTKPANLDVFEPATGTTIQVQVQGNAVAGTNSTISKLEIVEGAIVHATVSGNSINQVITLSAGRHPLRLRATDIWGEVGFSPIANINVSANNADYVSQSPITEITAGAVYNYVVTMRNSGSKPWSQDEGHAFAVPDPKIAETWGLPHKFPGSVAAGAQTAITIPIRAPAVPGTYDIEFQMLQGGREWFGERSLKRQISVNPEKPTVPSLTAPMTGERFIATGAKASVNVQGAAMAGAYASIVKLEVLSHVTVLATVDGDKINTTVELAPGTHSLKLRATDNFGQVVVGTEFITVTVLSNNATYGTVTVPAQMAGGQKYPVSVSMRNVGTSTWTAEDGYMLAAVTPGWENVRIPVPGPVAPNATVQFDFEATAPNDPGSYPFQWQMMRQVEGESETFGAKTLSKTVAVTTAGPPATEIIVPKMGETYTANGSTAPVKVGVWGKTYGSTTSVKSEILDGSQVVHTAVQPNYVAELQFAPGTHTLLARIIDSAGGTAQSKPITFTVVSNHATFIAQSVRQDMTAGERYPVWIKLRNTGTLPWQPGFVLRALNPVDSTTWNANGRIPLNAVVAPGSEYTFAFDVVAPSTNGAYNFQWRLENDKGDVISADTPNVGVTVGPIVVPTVTFKAAPGNVRVAPGQTAAIAVTGSASVQGGQISKLEVFKDSGLGYEVAPVKVVNGPAANLQINEAIALPGGTYRLKLRATDTGNRIGESAPVLVSITDSALLGVVSGVRSNAAQKLELVGWVCRAGSDEAMAYDIYVNAPEKLGGTKIGSGIANAGSEPSDGSVRTACGTAGSSHHFISSLAEAAVQYPGAKLYVEARANNGAQIILPCEDNNCRMPDGMRIGLTSPNASNSDRFRQPSPAFLRAQVTGASGAIDDVAFHVNGEWLPGVAEGGGAYSISKGGLTPSALPYITYAKVRQGGTTLITEERKFYIDAGFVPGVVSPATGTVVGLNRPTVLSIEINETVPAGATVKFYIDKVGVPAPLALEFGHGDGEGGGTPGVVGGATNSGQKWSYIWTPTMEGFYSVRAKLLDGAGIVLMETTAVTLAVSADVKPDPAAEPIETEEFKDLAAENAGTLPGSLSVGNDGAASYSIPLAVPPGNAGLEPRLSLNYSSKGANGMVGLGWSLAGLSTIHRCPKTIAQDGTAGRISFESSDRLCLDGMRLIRASGGSDDANYWAPEAQYRTEVEGFSRISRLQDGSFKVEEKNGRIHYYGNTAASAIDAVGPAGQLLWALGRTEDRSGNYMTLEYSRDATRGEYLPSLISYGGNINAKQAPDLAVRFEYEDRNDSQIQYIGGARNDLVRRLTHVKTFINISADATGGDLVRDLEIRYTSSRTSSRSLVEWMQASVFNSSSGKMEALPRTAFGWGDGGDPELKEIIAPFDLEVFGDNRDIPITTAVGDFDGSGKTSILVAQRGGVRDPNCSDERCTTRPLLNRLSGRTAVGTLLSTELSFPIGSGTYTDLTAGDLNGDGRDDLVLFDLDDRKWAYCLAATPAFSNDSPNFSTCEAGGELPLQTGMKRANPPVLHSFLNDGRMQLAYFNNQNQMTACAYSGDRMTCEAIAAQIPTNFKLEQLVPIQLSKQGTPHFYSIVRLSNTSTAIALCQITGSNLKCEKFDVVTDSETVSGQATGDVNGDGLADLIYMKYAPGSSKPVARLCQSSETGLECRNLQGWVMTDIMSRRFYYPGIGDFTGDGASRFWTLKDSEHPELCHISGEAEVCKKIETNGLSPSTRYAFDTVSRLIMSGPSEVPASLNCTSYPSKRDGRFYKTCWVTSVELPAMQDKMVSVVNGLGYREEVSYSRGDDEKVYTRYADDNGRFRIPTYPMMSTSSGVLVKQLRQDNGRGQMLATDFYYQGAMRNAHGRGDLGFAVMGAIDQATKIVTKHEFRQDFPFVGMPITVSKTHGSYALEYTNFSLETKRYPLDGGVTYFPFVKEKSVLRRDVDFTNNSYPSLGNVRTVNEYLDGWGNLNVQTVTTTDTPETKSYVTRTETKFLTEAGKAYLSGLPTKVSVMKFGSGMDPVTRTVDYEYDQNTGLRSKETIAKDTPLALETVFDRTENLYGLVKKVTQSWTDPACGDTLWPEKDCATIKTRTVSELEYEKGRFPYKVKNHLGQEEVIKYDYATGALRQWTTANGLRTDWVIDGLGRAVKKIGPDGNTISGQLKQCSVSCPSGAKMVHHTEATNGIDRIAMPELTYMDSAGRVLRIATWGFNGAKVVTDRRYDDRGRLKEIDQPHFVNQRAVLARSLDYDDLDRVTKVTTLDENGDAHSATIKHMGLFTEESNAKGQKRTTKRNEIGQVVEITDAKNGRTQLEYESFGNLARSVDPNKFEVVVKYDMLGRKVQLNDPNMGVTDYWVNPLGQVWAQQSRKQRPKGQKTYFAFDMLDRMRARFETDLESHWEYDSAANGVGKLAVSYTGTSDAKDYRRNYQYDEKGRLKATEEKVYGKLYSSVTKYDAWGRVAGLEYQREAGPVKSYGLKYNKYGYLDRILRGDKLLWQILTQDAGARQTALSFGNGLQLRTDFNPFTGLASDVVLSDTQERPLWEEHYSFDRIGNMQQRTRYWRGNGFIEGFSYDELNRLTSSQVTGKSLLEYSYDAVGNMKTKTGVGSFTYYTNEPVMNMPHALKSISGPAGELRFDYDLNGNMVSGAGRAMCWTSFNMPAKIVVGGNPTDCSGGSAWSTFVYGPEHQRTRQERSDGLVVVYAGAQEVEYKGDDETVKTYWPLGIGMEIDRPGASTPELYWTHGDHLGSLVAVTNQAGILKEQMEFDAWGKRRSTSDHDSGGEGHGVIDNKGYTGHEMLDQLGLVHMNGRVYDPVTSRFLSPDPMIQDPLEGQNYNRYSYVINNPLAFVDPSGYNFTGWIGSGSSGSSTGFNFSFNFNFGWGRSGGIPAGNGVVNNPSAVVSTGTAASRTVAQNNASINSFSVAQGASASAINGLGTEGERRQSILNGTHGTIRIAENPGASADEPFYEWRMQEQVTKYSGLIDERSAKYGVDPNLVKAIMYMETTHGWYDSWVAPFQKNTSILPMNVRPDTWAGLGYSREDLKNPATNIEAGIRIIKGIADRLDNPSVRGVATLYNSLAKDKVSDYGARVQAIYDSKPWSDPSLLQMRNARQSFREQYRGGQHSHPTYNQLVNE
ncbi:NBR1-Ig-like domain-containing protein [Pseudoduganella sp.]|uniref:NBR1-Ig-like domain-containing protein n=1 Tax=Pseudoduganella sp. TaxID=1880898 RepID=UPI0035AEA5F8